MRQGLKRKLVRRADSARPLCKIWLAQALLAPVPPSSLCPCRQPHDSALLPSQRAARISAPAPSLWVWPYDQLWPWGWGGNVSVSVSSVGSGGLACFCGGWGKNPLKAATALSAWPQNEPMSRRPVPKAQWRAWFSHALAGHEQVS